MDLRGPRDEAGDQRSGKGFVDLVVGGEGKTFGSMVNQAEITLKMSQRTIAVYLKWLTDNGLIRI